MIFVDSVLGSASDSTWARRLRSAQVDVLNLDQADARENRVRRTTTSGTDVAVCLERGTQVHDGDVLFWDDRLHTAIVARVELTDVMVIDLTALVKQTALDSMAACVELGHALGNQRWPAVIKGLRVYVPVAVAKVAMESVMKAHAFSLVRYAFVPGADVAARLTPHEARRLFGASA